MSNVPQSTFNIGLQMAVEQTYSVAPNSSTNGFYFQGGKWIPISVTGMPDVWDRQATIFPEGRAGSRARYNRRPIVGRRWSDGDFAFDVSLDILPLIAYGALGSMSSNAVPSTNGASLLELEPVAAATSKSIVLVNQPGDGGAILQIYVGGTSVGGWVSLSGIDPEGQGASEIINFSSAGSLYTRTSFSAIGASSVRAWSDNAATISINGFQYFEHTVSVNNTSNPSFSIQRYGDPSAGATSRMRVIPGLLVTELEINTPADARDGLVTASVSLEGNPTTACPSGSLTAVSPIRILPSWVLSVNREGSSFDSVQNLSFTITGGNRTYLTAAGVQNPQGAFYGSNMVEGSLQLLFNSENEYNKWVGASSNNLVFFWTTPYKLNSGNFEQMIASMNSLYYEDLQAQDSDDMQTLSADFRTINDADTGIIKLYFKNRLPGSSYSW